METETANLKKVPYTAAACSSYVYIQPTPPEPHPKAPYKIKIPRTLKEPLRSPEAPHWRQTLNEMSQHKKAKTHRYVKRPKDHYADIKPRKDIKQGRIKLHYIPCMDRAADGLTKAYQRTPIRHSKKGVGVTKIFWPT